MTGAPSTHGVAHARAGLLGNPSDGFGGVVLSCTVAELRAEVTLTPAPRPELPEDPGLASLVTATLAQHRAASGGRPVPPVRVEVATSIPRQVGLSGSSAIVLATLRALHEFLGTSLDPLVAAEVALDAEVVQLGITAGPQDRVVQSFEGLLLMDFAAGLRGARIRRLDPVLLPPLFLAWTREPGRASGVVHQDVRRRFAAGDPAVRAAMERFAGLAREGAACLEAGDHAGFADRVDRNFDLRAELYGLAPEERRIVEVGRAAGAAVKFSGSGGGAVGVLRDEADRAAVERAYTAAGFAVLHPTIHAP